MSDQPGTINEAASEALERWADTIPPEVRLRAEALLAGGAVTHLTPLAHGEWAAVVKDCRRHEVSATWDGAKWTIAWAGRSQPRSAAAAAAAVADADSVLDGIPLASPEAPDTAVGAALPLASVDGAAGLMSSPAPAPAEAEEGVGTRRTTAVHWPTPACATVTSFGTGRPL